MCLRTQICKCLGKRVSKVFTFTVSLQGFYLCEQEEQIVLFLLKTLLLYLLSLYYRYIENPHTIFREILINLIFCVMLALQGKELPYCSLMLLAQPQVVIHFHPCRKVCWSFSSALPHLLPKRKWTGKILAIQPTVSLEQETGHRKGRTQLLMDLAHTLHVCSRTQCCLQSPIFQSSHF